MREPTYPILLALALMLVAPPFSAFAQRGERSRCEDRFPLPNAPEEQTIRAPEQRTPPRNAPEEQTPLRRQTFGGHVYHGQLAWRDGRWRHEMRDGWDGWWWDVGGYWYYYPEPIEGPPDYVSGVEVTDDTTTAAPSAAPSPPATSATPSPPAKIWISPQ